jgi:hypothetical protein
MRYSGLTGACINAMSFNNFIKQAIDGVPFVDRFREFAQETNWSNGEVVQRGTSNNYGEDGFLRPGFSYVECIAYLQEKVIEHTESEQKWEDFLSRDWKIKMAAALVPRGMELNPDFRKRLLQQWKHAVYTNFLKQIENDANHRDSDSSIVQSLTTMKQCMPLNADVDWDNILLQLPVDKKVKETIIKQHVVVAKQLDVFCNTIIDFAAQSSVYNERVSSELFNQPKSVDSVVDDFAVEAQTLANSLILGAAIGSGILALNLMNRNAVNILSVVLGSMGSIISFGTMTST